jgi:Tol biopolymer transport system component
LQAAGAGFRFVVARKKTKAEIQARRDAMTETGNHPNEGTLESWKEIAAYLKRDVRTAKRWEKSEGLPIHRQMHHARGSVFAYPAELEDWKSSRDLRLNAPPVITPWRRATAGFAVVAAMLLALLTMGSGPIRTPSAAAAVPPDGITTRQVWAGPKTDFFGAVSPDGKYLSFVDWETGDLAVRNLAKETNRRLTNKGSWDSRKAEAEYSIWSPGGKQLVYQWFKWDTEPARYELRLVSLDNPTPRVLYRCKTEWIKPLDWSPDGKHILAILDFEVTNQQMVLISVADGSVRTLKTLPQSLGLAGAAISPDGQYVVYDYPQSESSLAHDIFLLPIAGRSETRLVKYPADDLVLGWTPDGNQVLFSSDRRGSIDVWAIRVEDGKPQGSAQMVKSAVGRIHPLGVTRSGSLYFGLGGNRNNVYVVEMDPATGKVLVPPEKFVKRFEGSNRCPTYSPDGKYLAYISKRIEGLASAGTGWGDTLCIRSLETGEEHEYQRGMIRAGARGFSRPEWSPDGRSMLLFGRDSRGRYAIYDLSLETGKAARLLASEEGLDLGAAKWRDSTSFFYQCADTKNNHGELRLRNLDSGTEKVVHQVSLTQYPMGSYSVSLDRQWLSVIDRAKSEEKVLYIISTESGKVRRVFRFSRRDQPGLIRHAWSADSKYVLYIKRSVTQDNNEWTVWRLPVEGGQPQITGLGMPRIIDYMSAHPDGEHVAFESWASESESPAVVWVMEDFLRKTVASK